jgi:dTMP kinase
MFITFEGIDYSGKSTQAKLLHEYFKSKKIKSIFVREPGGTLISEKIREILLHRKHLEMLPITEFFLFSASRAQLVNEVIKPNLKNKVVVICDRYFDSSTAYQGFGGKLDVKKINEVNDFAANYLEPDITFLLNITPGIAFRRAKKRGEKKDRMESKDRLFYSRVYEGFKTIANKNKKRIVLINGRKSVKNIHEEIIKIVNKKFK